MRVHIIRGGCRGRRLMSRLADLDPLLLDVTLRDGGYVNGHSWTARDARAIVRAVDAAGVPYAEVGYLRDAHAPLPPTAKCAPGYLEQVAEVAESVGLVVMVRPGDVPVGRVSELGAQGVSMVRVLVTGGSVERAAPYVAAGKDAGLTVAMNLTRVSERTPAEVAKAALACAEVGADLVYLADSNGSLDPAKVAVRVAAAVDACPVPIGFHPHDNLGLAYINTRTALESGATAVDASIAGIGKGGGNLRMEVIVADLIVRFGADLRIDPIATDQTTINAQLRMLADGSSKAVLTGLLDVNLDGAAEFLETVANEGYDAAIRSRIAHMSNTTR